MTSAPLERGYASGRATRVLLILTAERLFAERGFGAVSLREIGREANQRNPAVTQYHFGTREGLVAQIYAYRAATLNERRWELLRSIDDDTSSPSVRTLLRALILPHAESILDPDNHFLGFLSRLLVERGRLELVQSIRPEASMTAYDELQRRIAALLPRVRPRAAFEARFSMVFGWAIETLAAYEITQPSPSRAALRRFVDEAVTMLAAALAA